MAPWGVTQPRDMMVLSIVDVRDSRVYADVDASYYVNVDHEDDDAKIQARETIDPDNVVPGDKQERADFAMDAFLLPFHNDVYTKQLHLSFQNDPPLSRAHRKQHTKNISHETPIHGLSSPIQRQVSPLDILHIVSCCQTFCNRISTFFIIIY